MSMDLVKWTKYTYVCDPDECDSLIEYTCSDAFGFPSGSVTNITCPCGRKPQLLSVEDATISPLTKQKEENMEQTGAVGFDPTLHQQYVNEMELTYGNQITELQNTNGILAKRIESLEEYLTRSQGTIRQIIGNLSEDGWYNPNVDKEDVLRDLCEIVDHQPKKEISFEGTIRFSGRIDLPLEDADSFDLEDYLSDISVDVYNGDVVIDGYELENVYEA